MSPRATSGTVRPPGTSGAGWYRRARTSLVAVQDGGLFLAVVAMLVIFSTMNPRFMTVPNVTSILTSVAIVGVVAIPGAMLVISGYVDFAVGSIAVLAGIVFGELVSTQGLPVAVAAALALGIGLAWGAMAGALICKLRFSPIVVTLGGYAGLRGLAELISQGQTEFGFGRGFRTLGNARLLGFPLPVWILVALFVLALLLWYATPFGRYVTAIGAEPEAAHSLGIRVTGIPLQLYIASGVLAALGGLMLVSQLDASSLSIGMGLEIQVLTAILLGGVAFSGGRGSLVGVLLGVLFIGVLTNGLVVINISPYVTNVAVGAALIFAAGVDQAYLRLDRAGAGAAAPAADPDEGRPTAEWERVR